MMLSTIINAAPGELIGISNWRTLSQTRIDQFARATEDSQFIHVDPVRARHETPFGGTIAHGFLTLSMVSTIASDVIPNSSALKSVVIVAIDRVKFIAPVRSEQRIRGVLTLDRSHSLAKDRTLLKTSVVIEIDGEQKPALTCDVSWVATFSDVTIESEGRTDESGAIPEGVDVAEASLYQAVPAPMSHYDLRKT